MIIGTSQQWLSPQLWEVRTSEVLYPLTLVEAELIP